MSEAVKPEEVFELFQKMLNPMAHPLQSLLMASLDAKEIEKKVNELKVVRHWLEANIAMLDLTLKTLEYQRSILAPASGKPAENPFGNIAWPWNLMQQAAQAVETPAPKKSRRRAPKA